MASEIEGLLSTDQTKEAWRCLKGWYRSATDQPPKPCHLMMTRLTEERTELYAKVPTPGGRFPIVVDPFSVPDVKPMDGEVRDGVRWLRNKRAAGAGGMQAKHLKE